MRSIFNSVVPPHLVSPLLLAAINWDTKPEKDTTYPLSGEIRYVWMSEDYKYIKVLLKNGPLAWSEDNDDVIKQLEGHESIVGIEVCSDPLYIVATFEPILYTKWDRGFTIEELLENVQGLDEISGEIMDNYIPTTKDPFQIFKERADKVALDKGAAFPPDIQKFAKDLTNMIREREANIELGILAKDAGIDGMETSTFAAVAVNPKGDLREITDEFIPPGKRKED